MKDIDITRFGIADLIMFVTSMIAVIVGIVTFIWLINNWLEYRKKVKGAIYREKHGLFNISQYADNIIPAYVSYSQENRGPEPETYDRDIPCINYFETTLGFDKIEQDTEERRGAV